MTKAERKTVIQWDEESQTVIIWSASPVVLRKLARLGLTPTAESRSRSGELHGREYTLPLALFRWGLKARRKGGFLPPRPRIEASSSTERAPVHTNAPDTRRGPETA